MKSIILKGGLGNQLFQFCKFLELKKDKTFEKLEIDSNTGFLFDFKYQRKLEICGLKKSKKEMLTSLMTIFLIYFEKYLPFVNKFLCVSIINDKNSSKFNLKNKKSIIFNGYFQDYKIVNSNLSKLFKFIEPNFKATYSEKFEDLYTKIRKHKNSVAIGIRFYEESKNPLNHSSPTKKTKSLNDFNKIISYYESELVDPFFYLFVQQENSFTKKLTFNFPCYVVSHTKGYFGSWQRIKAQALCKHHIFNNSTFYFWGTIFSRFINKDRDVSPIIFVADNFIYETIYDPKWKKF